MTLQSYSYSNGYQGLAAPSSSLAGPGPGLSNVPDSPFATGVLTGTGLTFPSTIDPVSLPNLTVAVHWDVGVAAHATQTGTQLPVCMTPYTYDSLTITDPTREYIAKKGYVVILPVTRGRGFSPGAIDDSGRELYDFKDAIAKVGSSIAFADISLTDALGWSGGAASLIALVAKYPGLLRNVVCHFGWGDYGQNPNLGRSFWGAGIPGYQALMTTRIGDRTTQIERYQARCVWPALPYSLRQSTTRLWGYWDRNDPIGIALQDMATVLADPTVPPSRWQAEASLSTSSLRWIHGLPDSGSPDLFLLMNIAFQRIGSPAPTVASLGEWHVPGHIVVPASGAGVPAWELWTAETGEATPRASTLGGTNRLALARFNAASGLFYVTPLGQDCAIEILWNGISKVADCTMGETHLFDMAN